MKTKSPFYLFIFVIIIVSFLAAGCKVPEEITTPPINNELEKDNLEQDEKLTPQGPFSPYTGACVADIYPRPLCVLIENHPKARPQSGLAYAELVYEVPVEGGYTRFLALYASPYEGDIGPVRSARPYFAYLIKEHDGIMAHCGYSIHTEEVLKNIRSKYIDERFNPLYFWREKSRKMPHNLYTSLSLLLQGAEKKNYLSDSKESIQPFFTFKTSENQTQAVSKIKIKFSSANYVEYLKNSEGSYTRYNDGDLFIEAETGEEISVKNIIVQFIDAHTFTSEGHLRITLIGEGKGLLFSGGTVEEITWKKDSEQTRTVFTGENGKLLLAPGNTWIHLVPQSSKVEWSS